MLLIRNTPESLSGAPEHFLGFNYTTRLEFGGLAGWELLAAAFALDLLLPTISSIPSRSQIPSRSTIPSRSPIPSRCPIPDPPPDARSPPHSRSLIPLQISNPFQITDPLQMPDPLHAPPHSCSPISDPYHSPQPQPCPFTPSSPPAAVGTDSPGILSQLPGSLRRRTSPARAPLSAEPAPSPSAGARPCGPCGEGGAHQAELGAGPVHPERDVIAELRQRSAALGHRRHGRQEPAEQRRGRAGRPQLAAPPWGRGRARRPQPAAPHAGRRLRRGRAAPPPRRLPAAAINNRGSARRQQRHPGQRSPPQVRGRAGTERAEDRGEGCGSDGSE